MKKIKYFFPFLFLFIFIFSLSVNAEETDDTSDIVICNSPFEVGDTYSFYIKKTSSDNWEYEYILDYEITNDDERYCCMYLTTDNKIYMLNAPMGILNGYPPGSQTPQVSDYWFGNTGWVPFGYANCESYIVSSSGFSTNIPIFSSQADAESYVNGDSDLIKSAINYKKTYENGSWVKPFEDIEINDNDMLIPSLSNLSHNGFSISNRAEEYGVDVYVVSGLRQPGEFIHDVDLDLSDYLYGHTLGWLTNDDKVYTQDSFDLIKDFGVDNVTLLNESVNSFYTEYPNARAYYPDANFMTKVYYDVWGAPFGTTYFSYNDVTKVTAPDLMGVDCYDIPLCFTCYKVRFYYYDENDGMHYGPWAVVTYCSNGDIKASTSYVGNDGSVIDTPTDFGKQDEQGNISYDNNNYSEFIDLGDVNGLFATIRSIFNNLSATTGSFSTLFASVFNFLPPEILAIIFGGIGAMVLIGIIKAVIG